MNHLEGLLRLIDSEFGAIENNGKFRSKDEIEYVYKLIDIAKDVYCIWDYEESMGDDYSMNSYRGTSYDDEYSHARGRGSGANRYNDGRYAPYSREGGRSYEGNSYRNSYRRNGYSRDDGKEEYMENLREMMQNAPDENTRQGIQRMINQMSQM